MQNVWAQLILIKRQIEDNASLLVVGIGVALLFLLVSGVPAFIYPRAMLLHVTIFLIVLPMVVGSGALILGSVQMRSREDHEATAMLSVLGVTAGQLARARIMTGLGFVTGIVLCLVPAVCGAVVAGLLLWPESLFPAGLIDLSVALLLIGCACYCLGLLMGRRDGGLIGPVRYLFLVVIVVSLIIIKGFGQPLNRVLLPFILVLLVYLSWFARRPHAATIPLALIVLTLTAIPLHWLRYSSDVLTAFIMLAAEDEIIVSLYHEFRPKTDYYSGGYFEVSGEVDSYGFPLSRGCAHFLLCPIGILSYLQAREPGGDQVDLGHFGHYWGCYYDRQTGVFVERSTGRVLYAGPEGVSDTPHDDLGRFLSPIICRRLRNGLTVFDPGSRCFYRISFEAEDVWKGLHLSDTTFRPVAVTTPWRGQRACFVDCDYRSLRDGEDVLYGHDKSGTYMPVVDESGAVAVVDLRTWRLFTGVGHLPRPRTFFGRGSSRPRDLFDFDVEVIVKRPTNEYAGLMVASLSRQGMPLTVAVFDKNGHLLRESASLGILGAASLFTPKHLIESLHPPILTLASFFMAYSFDAGATHRTLFLMPNSFVALQRDRETSAFAQLLWALVFLVPALVFSGFLSSRVVRDARGLGLSWRARGFWLVGTLALGLPAYITYRLTRRRVVIAPCRNCGRGRRVDMDLCHHCGKGWDVPELEPPPWRITSDMA